MRQALVLVALLLGAGCASAPVQDDPDRSAYAFVSSRTDADGDGLYDHVSIGLVAAPEPLPAERLTFQRNGEPVEPVNGLEEGHWRPGGELLLACGAGLHEFRVLLDGEVRKVAVHECGVRATTTPPGFEGRVIDGDADGRKDAVQLRLLQGAPVEPRSLTVSMGDQELRLYTSPLKSRVARGPISAGQAVYTPCVPEATALNVTWQGDPLPTLTLAGCEVFDPGVDAPLSTVPVDADQDGRQDGWNFTLGAPNDGPFQLSELKASWRTGNTSINGSVGLAPPPDPWGAGQSLVIVCPGDGKNELSLWVRGSLVFRVSETACEAAPGQPLLVLDMEAEDDVLSLTLRFSRVDPLNASRLATPSGTGLDGGSWEMGEVRELACPGGELVLHYEDRLAFRGPAPC